MLKLGRISKVLSRQSIRSSLGLRTASTALKYKAGDELFQGWKVVGATNVPEYNLENVVHLKHEHCNAQWLHMENSGDETNAFCVHFKTVPQNSTGIAHILEHCTLCGSNNFPVRDPFMKMLNRSMATMNAMTGQDYTFYPFATPNKNDFYNLMQVYLDAVFNPLLRELDFRQEGWRLDFDKEKNDLAIKGVVFNEMKGVYSDSQTEFGQRLQNLLLPSDTYSHCSGGLPECIPRLTWNDLRQFHSVHYSPNNARFYSYGNLPLENHLEAVGPFMPASRPQNIKDVPDVPSEPRWSTPRKEHMSCADDETGASNTIAVSYLLCPIDDTYETFVLRAMSELLIGGPNAPLYKALIEAGLGTAFSPVTGYDSYTKDTSFTIGLQGIDKTKANDIEKIIIDTIAKTAETGFESDRVQAILNKTELSLKKQRDNFGWSLILSLVAEWNHASDPLDLVKVNPILERFREDIKDEAFFPRKIREYFIENNHRLTMTMSPESSYLAQKEGRLTQLEEELVKNLSEEQRQKALEQGQLLEKMQTLKEDLSCLPSLTLADIPEKLPNFGGVSNVTIGGLQGQLSSQETNEIAYTKLRLNTESVFTPREKELLPLFTMVMTSMGAGSKSYRDIDLLTELHTGGLGSSLHLAESPLNAGHLLQNGLMFSAVQFERKTPEMLSILKDIFHGLLVPHEGKVETSTEGLKTRLNELISMAAVTSQNELAYGGHAYAMRHASSKLLDLPALVEQEKRSGITMVRLLNALSNDQDKITKLLQEMTTMSRKLLTSANIETFSLTATPQKSETILKQLEDFIADLPSSSSGRDVEQHESSSKSVEQDKNTFIVAPFQVHFNSSALKGAPSYTHPDAAPLRVLARILSSKYLHTEIREKGGAYGGGCTASPSSGSITFYSYRDPNLEKTFEAFHSCNQWVQKGQESFTDKDVEEGKLSVFKGLDKPALPSSRGQRLFLYGITDTQFEEHRRQIRNVSYADLQRVSQKYLGESRAHAFSSSLGPESSASSLKEFKVEQLL